MELRITGTVEDTEYRSRANLEVGPPNEAGGIEFGLGAKIDVGEDYAAARNADRYEGTVQVGGIQGQDAETTRARAAAMLVAADIAELLEAAANATIAAGGTVSLVDAFVATMAPYGVAVTVRTFENDDRRVRFASPADGIDIIEAG